MLCCFGLFSLKKSLVRSLIRTNWGDIAVLASDFCAVLAIEVITTDCEDISRPKRWTATKSRARGSKGDRYSGRKRESLLSFFLSRHKVVKIYVCDIEENRGKKSAQHLRPYTVIFRRSHQIEPSRKKPETQRTENQYAPLPLCRRTDMTRCRSRLPAATATTILFTVVALCFFPLEASAHEKFTFTTTHANELAEGFFQGGVESQIKHIFEETLSKKVTAADSSSVAKARTHAKAGTATATPPSLSVIDVGVNTGFFTLLAAAHGATVYGFELQRTCLSRVREHLANNPRLSRSVYLFNLGLGQEADVVEDNAKDVCDGSWGHQGLEKVSSSSSSSGGTSGSSSSTLTSSIVLPDAVFQDWWDIALMKVDTEGAEAAILKRFLKYIERGQVRNVVVEVVPAWWPKRGVSVEHGIQVFEQLQSMARETVLLHDMNPFPQGARPRAQNIDGLPTFDITDMRALLRQRASTASSGLNIWFKF